MRLMGHKTRHIFQRYNVVVADDLVNATKAVMALEGAQNEGTIEGVEAQSPRI
jgi:uncharacterized protein YhbP (UPF0306 family)